MMSDCPDYCADAGCEGGDDDTDRGSGGDEDDEGGDSEAQNAADVSVYSLYDHKIHMLTFAGYFFVSQI